MSFKRQRFIKEHSEEIKPLIREYLKDFIEIDICNVEETFNSEKYLDSVMEGELYDMINDEFYDEEEDEGPLVVDGTKDSDHAFEQMDNLVDEVLLEPGFETARKYFEQSDKKELQ